MADTTGWSSDTFSFTLDFQKQIIAAMLQEPKIFERLGILIDHKSFETTELQHIFKGMQQFFGEYSGLPNKEALANKVLTEYNNETVTESINEIYEYKKLSISSLSYVEDATKNFVSCQALKKAIYESLNDLGDISKHVNVKDRIEKALTIGATFNDLGIDVYDDETIINRWKMRKENKDVKRLLCGWNKFNTIFGGFGVGELFTFAAPANAGKSMYLINVGADMLLSKLNVLHITLEMSEEIVSQRYDMRLLGLTKEELKSSKSIENVKNLLEKRIGKLIIKRYPSGTITAADITVFIKRLESIKGFIPDILIVDYAEIMKASSKYYEKRFELDSIYQQLRNIGIEFNIPVITATQLRRAALEKLESGKILTEEDIAESYGIARIIDCGVTINATPADNMKNASVVYTFKNRDGAVGEQFRMYVDFTKALVKEWSPTLNIKMNRG